MKFVAFLVIVVGLFEGVSSQECTDKEIKSSVKKFQNKCLEAGFQSSLAGCTTTESAEQLSKRQAKKCEEIEEFLSECEANCEKDNACKSSEEKLAKTFSNFERKCLNMGYVSTLAGCKSAEGGDTSNAKKCENMEDDLANCDINCQVDGGWSDFGDWSDCSVDCGDGERTRERECNNPAPKNGGAECEGDAVQIEKCSEDPCPVDGGWSDYTEWTECSAKCDGGTQTRSRTCSNPAPAYGGADCQGESSQERDCNTQACVEYRITHTTGTAEHAQGKTSGGYLFTLIGTEGSTGPHDCSADRTQGATGDCIITDPVNIGKLKQVKIKNVGDNSWDVVSIFVEIEGVLRGRWFGESRVPDYKTIVLSLTNIGDEEIEYEITHKTGNGKHDAGGTSGVYLFTLMGSAGNTAPFDCPADRSRGAVGTCTISDAGEIGTIQKVKVQNLGSNRWVFKTFTVKVDGEVKGHWKGSKPVPDYSTVFASSLN